MPDEFDKDFWECRYRAHSGGHDGGGPNPTLVTEAGELAPGLALDAGCGHGADATWLASRGWQGKRAGGGCGSEGEVVRVQGVGLGVQPTLR